MPTSASPADEVVGGDLEVVFDGEVGQQPAALGHDGDTGAADLVGLGAGEVDVADVDRAAGRLEHAADREHERALAGAVRAEQRGDLAGRDDDRDDAFKHRAVTARHVEPGDLRAPTRRHTSTSSVPR